MDQMTNQQRIKSESKALDFQFGVLLGRSPVVSPAAIAIGDNLGNYSRQLNNAQASQLVMYSVANGDESNATETEERPFVVTRLTHESKKMKPVVSWSVMPITAVEEGLLPI